MKALIAGPWTLVRILRIGIGIFFLANIPHTDQPWIFGSFGSLLLVQGLLNAGCCGADGCATGITGKQQDTNPEQVTYEEIK